MVILKKIKASTLMETLVATVLIIVIFILASTILNNLFSNSFKNNTREVDAYINELRYLYKNEKLTTPFQNDFKEWQVSVDSYMENNQKIIEFEAKNINTQKTILKQYLEAN